MHRYSSARPGRSWAGLMARYPSSSGRLAWPRASSSARSSPVTGVPGILVFGLGCPGGSASPSRAPGSSSASALAPRVRHHAEDPALLRYFGHAAKFGSPQLLLDAIAKVADQQTARTGDQLWVISRLVVIKYRRIRIALVALAVAGFLMIVAASVP